MDGPHVPTRRLGPSPAEGPSTRVRRLGWLLFATAVSAIAAGMAAGQGLLLAAGLVLVPVGLHLTTAPAGPGEIAAPDSEEPPHALTKVSMTVCCDQARHGRGFADTHPGFFASACVTFRDIGVPFHYGA